MNRIMKIILISQLFISIGIASGYSDELGNYQSHVRKGRSVLISTTEGKVRLTPYGDHMLRVQVAREGKSFTADDRYEMVMNHNWPGELNVEESDQALRVRSKGDKGYELKIQKSPLRFSWFEKGVDSPVLVENKGVVWQKKKGEKDIVLDYMFDSAEHFAGSGAPGIKESRPLDLQGQIVQNRYPVHGGQLIPFFISSKGYGIFINSSFPTEFNFGADGNYRLTLINTSVSDFAMDYFYISGPEMMSVVQRYTDLTGKPRLIQRGFLGLQLSDRGAHSKFEDMTVDSRWKNSVKTLRDEGFPLDVVIFDNLWRAGGGGMRTSRFEWDLAQVADPVAFGAWLKGEGLLLSLDLNRQNNKYCKGWDSKFNINFGKDAEGWRKADNKPMAEGDDDRMTDWDSCPDYTSPEVRDWSWHLIKREGFGPNGDYPMNAIWIDGTDHIRVSDNTILANGWRWAEVKNYYTFLIAKTFIQDGWDKDVGEKERPYGWVRSASPGVQRYMIHWTGDIQPTRKALDQQVINLQSSGIAGFSYFNHDAGGYKDGGPTEDLYRQWTCAFASFTPIWRPHGTGPKNSRRPDAWSEVTQKDFMEYARVRYEMIPYIYTYAHEAAASGTPMARAMFLEYPEEKAWEFPYQFMWGKEMLVAPNVEKKTHKTVWLPKGEWYDFWTKGHVAGDRTFVREVPVGRIPVYVKAGAIIPKVPYCLSTQFIPKNVLNIDVYLGAEGEFALVEDDNVTEKFLKGELQKTKMELCGSTFVIHPVEGSYDGAVSRKDYTVTFFGVDTRKEARVNGMRVKSTWDAGKKMLVVSLLGRDVSQAVKISLQ